MSDIGSNHPRLRCDPAHPLEMEEILSNILPRLPVKDVASCKCVSKQWLSVISEPGFPQLQLTWSRKNLKYIICPYPEDHDIVTHLCVMEDDERNLQDIPLPDLKYICSPEVICFSNGLICSVEEDSSGRPEIDIRIFNPITRDSVVLPRGSISEVIPTVAIAFDPITSDFKVFRFFSDKVDEEDIKYKCEVYASGSNLWKMISEEIQRPEHNPHHSICPYFASVAGGVYWFDWKVDEEPVTPSRILSFDMNEKFSEVEMPPKLNHWSFLIELEGCLSLVLITNQEGNVLGAYPDPNAFVEVYKFDGGEWKLRSKVETDLTDVSSFNSVAARENEIFIILKHLDESFIYRIIDLDRKTTKELDWDEEFVEYTPIAFPFAESLLKCSGK